MRICISADWQFDTYEGRAGLHSSGVTNRLHDATECWKWMCKVAVADGCTRMIVLGDLFEKRTSIDVSVLHVVGRCMEHATSHFDAVSIIPGNHDSYLRNAKLTALQMFAGARGVEVHTQPAVRDGYGYVPWTDEPEDFVAGVKEVQAGKAGVLCAHVTVEGSVPGGGGVPLSSLRPGKFRRVFLGDIHEPMQLADNVMYVGSPMQIDYRDAGGTRGFVIYDDAEDLVEYVPNTESPRFHVAKSVDDLEPVRENDFVWVRTADACAAAEVVKTAAKVTSNIRARVVPDEIIEETPRLSAAEADDREKVFEAYVRHAYPGLADEDVAAVVSEACTAYAEAGGVIRRKK